MSDLTIRESQNGLQAVRQEQENQRLTQPGNEGEARGIAGSHLSGSTPAKTGTSVKGVNSFNASDFVEAYFILGKLPNIAPLHESEAAAAQLESSKKAMAGESNVQTIQNVHNLDILRSQLLK